MLFYRLLLRLYPASFRAEYGSEMCAVYLQRRRDASNALSILLLWLETIANTLFDALRVHWDILQQDLRYAARTLSRSAGFTATAILVAALGIGANTAAFSLTDHVLIRPLPFADSDRLMILWEDQSPRGYFEMEPSPANFRDWKRMSTAFEGMAAWHSLSVNLVGQGEPERFEAAALTADFLPLLGVRPVIGRVFSEADDRDGASGTLLISDGLWKRRFGADPGVIGRKVILDDAPYTVIGVMPPAFCFPRRDIQIWTTTRFKQSNFVDRNDNWLHVVARLRPGVSLDQARAEMRLVAARLEQMYPKENAHIGVNIVRMRDQVSTRSRMLLMALLGAAFCVLLIACTNLANLFLARALVRRKELAVRAAIGAGRERLARQVLTESLVLALCGGALGVLVAIAGLPLLARLVPTSLPIAETPAVDWRVLLFAAGLAGLTGIGFGIVPAMRACCDLTDSGLREGSRAGVGGRKERLRSALVIAEVTGSVVLLVACGLLIRALWRLQSTDPGFRTDGVLTMRTWLPLPKYAKTDLRAQFYERVLSGVRALPGVSGAAYISFLPIAQPGGIWRVMAPGHPRESSEFSQASLRFITPGLFSTLGIPLRLGRDVDGADTIDKPFVAVVSESFVRKYWPRENPLGRHFMFAFADRTVVGVVGDIRVRGFERSSEPQVYLPYRQVPDAALPFYTPKDLVIHASAGEDLLLPAIRGIVRQVDSDQPISDVRAFSEVVAGDTAPRLVQVRVLGAFAAIAFLLAAIGIHGLLSFAVSNRRQEIGVRIALGAQSGDILKMVLGQVVALAAAGVVLGVTLAYAAGRTLEALLAGVKPSDAATFLAAVALALLMTILGSILPAIRAVRVDPTTVIRAE